MLLSISQPMCLSRGPYVCMKAFFQHPLLLWVGHHEFGSNTLLFLCPFSRKLKCSRRCLLLIYYHTILCLESTQNCIMHQKMIQLRYLLQCADLNPACVGQYMVNVYTTRNYAQNVNIYHFETVSSSHQVKSEFASISKLPRYFSFKTPSFPQLSMVVAYCYNG